MINKIAKKISNTLGFEIQKRDQNIDLYNMLFDKYQDFTMIPKENFLLNLELCDQHKNIIGDVVECGVWRGGMAAAMSEVFGKNRMIHLFDSFEGLPKAKEIDGTAAQEWQADTKSPNYYNNCTADESFAIRAMALANHTLFNVHKGWFEDTLKNFEKRPISVLRLDGDWYDSIKICLEQLFPYVVQGGIVILDDYYAWEGCTKAVHDYLAETKSHSQMRQWNNQIGYIIKKC